MDPPLKKAVMERADAGDFAKIYRTQPGYQRLYEVGQALVKKGVTDEAELNRLIDAKK
jgi:type II secretory ATPase GspE/PulE/Tfp pilus assembly ATPase PilB-like protein